MYTIKGLLDKDGHAAILASCKDWREAKEKAATFRKEGLEVEIWHSNGVKVVEPEIDLIVTATKAPPLKIPQTEQERAVLPEYEGPDAVGVYSFDDQAVFWTDAKANKWWLAQRQDGTYCKMPTRD